MNMNNNYTLFNEQSLSSFTSIDYDLENAIDFIKDASSFRTFDIGLKELLKRKGYNFTNHHEAAQFLISKLRAIHSTIEDATVYSWFSGKHRPKIEAGSRKKIYEICFALNLTYEETVWVFNCVYYDRAFNCHSIEEAVYYYAFLNGLPYQKALQTIDRINKAIADKPISTEEVTYNYTQFVQMSILNFKTTQELEDFLIAHKENFNSWNTSALNRLKSLLLEIKGDEKSKLQIDALKRTLNRKLKLNHEIPLSHIIYEEDYLQWGLLIREIIFDAKASSKNETEYLLETIGGKNIRTNTFVLDHLLSTVTGLPKHTDIPYVIKNNFPSKKVMSDILDESKVTVSKSYDAIRKMIVLLDFYVFWVRVKLGITNISELNLNELPAIYKDEADHNLYQCGYEPLYVGNPYDWIFLCASKNKEPLSFFRAYIADLL